MKSCKWDKQNACWMTSDLQFSSSVSTCQRIQNGLRRMSGDLANIKLLSLHISCKLLWLAKQSTMHFSCGFLLMESPVVWKLVSEKNKMFAGEWLRTINSHHFLSTLQRIQNGLWTMIGVSFTGFIEQHADDVSARVEPNQDTEEMIEVLTFTFYFSFRSAYQMIQSLVLPIWSLVF